MNKRLKSLCYILLIGCKAFSQSDSVKIFTLKQCVETAISNNLQVKQSDLLVQDAAISVKQAKANQLPSLSGNLNHGISQGRSIDPFTNSYSDQSIVYGNYNINTSIVLSNGYQLKSLVKENQLAYEGTKWDLQTARDNLTLNIILAYLQILNNEELVLQSENQAALTKKQVERLDILNKEGAIIPSQLYELKGQLSNDELSVVTNQNALQTSRLTLSQLMNIPYDPNMEVEKLTADNYAVYSTEAGTIYNSAVQNLAEVKAAGYKTQSAAKAIDVARADLYPQIGLGGSINTNYSNAAATNIFLNSVQVPSGDYVTLNGSQLPVITTKSNYNVQKINYFNQFTNNYNTSVGVSIHIPILNAWRARNNIALAKNTLKSYQYTEELTKTQLRQSVEQAYLNMTSAYKKYQLLLQQVADFTEAFRGAEVRFTEGVSTEVDYLIAKNNLDRAKINLISARYDYVFQTRILDFYQGKLVL